MLRRLAFSGVRVSQLTARRRRSTATTFPAGTWVVPTDQEFAALAREVLDVQKYPEIRESPSGPLDQPYDAAGWTLPLSMGVERRDVANAAAGDDVRAKMRPLSARADRRRPTPTPYNLGAVADAAPFDSVPGIGFDTRSRRARRSCRRRAASRAPVRRSP